MLQRGDVQAVDELWQCCYARLLATARRKLPAQVRRIIDDEDVALSAFDTFCRRASNGQFPHLLDRDDLWKLLLTLTARKATQQRRHLGRQKRGGQVQDQPGQYALGDRSGADVLAQVPGNEQEPATAAEVAEEMKRLLGMLEDETLAVIAVQKLEGYTDQQVADQLKVARRTVERKLVRIRQLWEKELV
jgi:DNA-directed RNA polymerase specialized sigma24 family protein